MTDSTVYQKIAAVTGDLAKIGISKDSTNDQQGWKFRGIDAVYNVLSGLLSSHGLCLLPIVKSRSVTERVTAKGSTVFYVVLDVDYDIVSTDGSKHTVSLIGEAMDSGDKATNKAMSAAYKYMALQVFCIPTEGDNDADKTTHEVAPPKLDDVIKDEMESAAVKGIEAFREYWKQLDKETRKTAQLNKDWFENLRKTAEGVK
jgi:ERF superfamily